MTFHFWWKPHIYIFVRPRVVKSLIRHLYFTKGGRLVDFSLLMKTTACTTVTADSERDFAETNPGGQIMKASWKFLLAVQLLFTLAINWYMTAWHPAITYFNISGDRFQETINYNIHIYSSLRHTLYMTTFRNVLIYISNPIKLCGTTKTSTLQARAWYTCSKPSVYGRTYALINWTFNLRTQQSSVDRNSICRRRTSSFLAASQYSIINLQNHSRPATVWRVNFVGNMFANRLFWEIRGY